MATSEEVSTTKRRRFQTRGGCRGRAGSNVFEPAADAPEGFQWLGGMPALFQKERNTPHILGITKDDGQSLPISVRGDQQLWVRPAARGRIPRPRLLLLRHRPCAR